MLDSSPPHRSLSIASPPTPLFSVRGYVHAEPVFNYLLYLLREYPEEKT
jgi:hypothetical protein